ncbi:hypothetical protein SANTM175S_07051 [Streptomyces antimycoticus]
MPPKADAIAARTPVLSPAVDCMVRLTSSAPPCSWLCASSNAMAESTRGSPSR